MAQPQRRRRRVRPPAGELVNPVPGSRAVSEFGASRGTRSHRGIDLAAKSGTAVRAALGGTVLQVGYSARGRGHFMVIDHGKGRFTSYAHLQAKTPLKVGAKVAAGAQSGKVGQSGNAVGPHLHFEMIRGTAADAKNGFGKGALNPRPYLFGGNTF